MIEPKLRVVARRLMEIIQPGEQLDALDRVRQAIDSGGNVVPGAGQGTVPLQAVTWFVPGTLTTGNNKALEYVVPEACRVVRYGARVKVAPATVQIMTRLTVNGANRYFVNIPVNGFENASAAATASTLAARDIVRLDITQVGSAASPGIDLTVYLYVQPILE